MALSPLSMLKRQPSTKSIKLEGSTRPSMALQSPRLLIVEVLEARNIKACIKPNISDPYLTCSLMDLGGREIKNETFKTKHLKSTLAPSWHETFQFGAFSVSETPLGKVEIRLDTLTCNDTDMWYTLMKDARTPDATGDLHVRAKFSRAAIVDDLESGHDEDDGAPAAADTDALLGDDAGTDAEDLSPNMLEVKLFKGRKLPIMDTDMFGRPTSSDPVCVFEIKGVVTQESTVIKKNINPEWNEMFTFDPVCDTSLSLQVTVQDYNNFTTRDNMGKILIPLNEFSSKKAVRRWFKVQHKNLEADGVDRGDIEMEIKWSWNAKVAERMRVEEAKKKGSVAYKLKHGLGHLAGNESESEPDDGDDGGVADNDEEAKPESEEDKKKREEEEAEHKKSLTDIEIKDGDYQVQVHIIEARDLKAENADGTSDPVCYVECLAEKQHTRVIYGQTTCVFDELLIFNFRALDKEQFEQGTIRIAVRDSNSVPMMGNTMIGAFAVDLSQVYTGNKSHEMYRQWIPLMDDEDAEDTGVQGYLKISIQIVGPGEKLKIHDEAAELAKEIAKESSCGGDIGSLVLTVPTIRKEWMFLVVSVYRAEGLPVMDGKVGVGMASIGAKTDAFGQLSFGGGKPLKTKVKTVFGENRNAINPVFNYDLWYPVSIPTMTSIAKFSVFDADETENELIGLIFEKYNLVDKAPQKRLDPRWYNMYGAPEFKQEKALANVKKGLLAVKKRAAQSLMGDVDWKDSYNNIPDKASTFKGRVLLRFRIQSSDSRPGRHKVPEITPFRKQIKGLTPKQEPATRGYVLQALVICGTDLPSFTETSLTGLVSAGTKKQDLRVRVNMGPIDIATKAIKYEHGLCRWNEIIRSEPTQLPLAIDQLPDIFIYLVRDDMKPVCYTRIKAADVKTKELLGFHSIAHWYLLQEDKVIDALDNDVFPGSLLIKLGFGFDNEVKAVQSEWEQNLRDAQTLESFQARVHLYQGRDIPAADSNGLCDPYLKVKFMGQEVISSKKKKTLYPAYYETLVFDNVMIPAKDNFRYASQVSLRLYDTDSVMDEYLGMCNYNLENAIISEDPKAEITVDPTWLDFFREVPKDGQGQILVLVQLIPTMGRNISKDKKDMPDITPKTRTAYIEMIAVGVREMAPFNFQPMQAPFLEIELNSFGSSYLAATSTSKKPNPSNPNFLEKIEMEVQLPEKSIFAAPLQLRAKDTRLGGYLKPIVGVGVIDLSTKLPWCPETYKAPAMDMFFQSKEDRGGGAATADDSDCVVPGANSDAVAQKVIEMQSMVASKIANDDFIATPEPPSVQQFIQERIAEDDTGAGVFGALHHIALDGKKKKKGQEAAFTDADWSQDDTEQPPAWQIGRKTLESELEVELKTTPFETYPLTRGKAHGMFGGTLKIVGKFKGLIRVKMTKDEPDLLSKEMMDQLMKPKSYKVRLYVLKGLSLAKMDTDIFGARVSSDPYLKVHLGKYKFNDRANAIDKEDNPDFYKLIEIDCELPGTSQLVLEVMDKDIIGSDDLIGKTTIDLEDRWFDSRWQALGEENVKLPSDNKSATDSTVRWQTKPIENRTIYQPSMQQGQGVIQCWLDIMKPEVATQFPPDDVALPPKQIFEVRVVIWKTRDVPPMDNIGGMSDLFVKCWPEGCKPQETDTHWRCKKGKASFNWRILFDVELGHSTRAMKFPYFHLQLWDRDILKWNDCAGEGVINMGKYFRKAYKRNVALKLFEKKQGAMASRAKQNKLVRRDAALLDTNEDIPPEETDEETKEGDTAAGAGAAGGGATGAGAPDLLALAKAAHDKDSDDDDDDDSGVGALSRDAGKAPTASQGLLAKTPLSSSSASASGKAITAAAAGGVTKTAAGTAALAVGKSAATAAAGDKATAAAAAAVKPKAAGWSLFSFWKKKEPAAAGAEGTGEEDPLIKKDEEEKKEDDDDELKDLVNTFKNMTGLWDIDPPDSDWYKIETHDHNSGDITPMGSICYSIQIWPKEKATAMPVGPARQEPNTNPFCPPPTGRLKFSWNPFVLGSELCGPAMCAKLFCCFIFLAFILTMIFCQPFLNIIINLIFVVY